MSEAGVGFPKALVGIILLFFSANFFIHGCKSTESAYVDDVQFEVVDSLLGLPYFAGEPQLSIRPPSNYYAIADSLFGPLEVGLAQTMVSKSEIDLLQCYADSNFSAYMLIMSKEQLRLDSDTAGFFGRYFTSLIASYGGDNVLNNEFFVGTVFVKQFIYTENQTVHLHLFCMQPGNAALEIHYLTPHAKYQNMLRVIESSIGSLTPFNKEQR